MLLSSKLPQLDSISISWAASFVVLFGGDTGDVVFSIMGVECVKKVFFLFFYVKKNLSNFSHLFSIYLEPQDSDNPLLANKI
jgi:hypothetical protein